MRAPSYVLLVVAEYQVLDEEGEEI